MGKRYGIAVKRNDGLEEISTIMEKEGGPPVPGSKNARVIADLDPKVRIGMVSGGKGEAVAGFGFDTPTATPPITGDTDEERAEAKIAASEARLKEAKGDDDFDQRQREAETASTKKAAADKAADDKSAAKKS